MHQRRRGKNQVLPRPRSAHTSSASKRRERYRVPAANLPLPYLPVRMLHMEQQQRAGENRDTYEPSEESGPRRATKTIKPGSSSQGQTPKKQRPYPQASGDQTVAPRPVSCTPTTGRQQCERGVARKQAQRTKPTTTIRQRRANERPQRKRRRRPRSRVAAPRRQRTEAQELTLNRRAYSPSTRLRVIMLY